MTRLSLFAALGLAAALGGCSPVGYTGCGPEACSYPQPRHQRDYVYVRPHPVAYPPGAGDLPFEDPGADYSRRSLLISQGAGNDHAANLALQTATPWPRHSHDTTIPGNGSQMARAINEYESGRRESESAKRTFQSGSGGGGAAGGISTSIGGP